MSQSYLNYPRALHWKKIEQTQDLSNGRLWC